MSSIELTDGVIVDAENGIAHIMGAEGGVSALDLTNGEVLWTSEDAVRPLLAAEELLVVQAKTTRTTNTLQLATLDARGGGGFINESPLRLPDNVRPDFVRSPTRSFALHARADEDQVVIDWEFRDGQTRALPDEEDEILTEELPEEDDFGSLEMVPAIFPETPMASVQRGQATLSLIDGRVEDRGISDLGLEAQQLPQTESPLAEIIEPTPVILEVTEDEPTFLSRDRKHYMRSELIGDEAWGEYQWSIFDAQTHQLVGQIVETESSAPFVVLDDRLLTEMQPMSYAQQDNWIELPRRLVAYNLKTAERLWARPLMDPLEAPAPPP